MNSKTPWMAPWMAGLAGLLLGTAVLCWSAGTPATALGDTLPGNTLPPDVTPIFLPAISNVQPSPTPTPPPPSRVYDQVVVRGGSFGRPAQTSPDANLAVRGYVPTTGYLGLVNYGGAVDDQAPQIEGMFAPPRLPAFTAVYQVYDWNWGCNPPDGCKGQPISDYAVTLLAMATTPGEPLAIPSRGPTIDKDFRAMVVYAEPERISFVYTDRDTPAIGYLIHLEGLAVAPELVALYQQLDAAGRKSLPALRNGETLGIASGDTVKIATRDTGQFLDPRTCKDWWRNYTGQCTVRLPRPVMTQHLPPVSR